MQSFIGLFRLSLGNLLINKLRSALTVLGMVFGTGAVIATMSSNEGASRYIKKELQKLGTNIITVRTEGDFGESDKALLQKYSKSFESLSFVDQIGGAQARYEANVTGINLSGVDPNYFHAIKLNLVSGRFFDHTENEQSHFTAVIGSEVKKALFKNINPIGRYIHLAVGEDAFVFLVVGHLLEKGGTAGGDIDNGMFIPKSVARKIAPDKSLSTYLSAVLAKEDASAIAKAQIASLWGKRFINGLHISDAKEAIERTTNVWGKQNMLGMILALVSLLTGGVGIMNIMLLSVTQRRKEIGLRKAVGASDLHILVQFLLEAVIVCLLGGAVGIAVGMLFGTRVAHMLGQWEAAVSPLTVILALAFATATGILFGLLPALRASRLDPFDALRM